MADRTQRERLLTDALHGLLDRIAGRDRRIADLESMLDDSIDSELALKDQVCALGGLLIE